MYLASWRWLIGARSSASARREAIRCFRPTLELLESRRVPTTLFVSPTGSFLHHPAFKTIQAALDHATRGDKIEVGPGTYQEQLLVTTDHVRIESAIAFTAVIQAPATNPLAGNLAIVDVAGATGVSLAGFVITGPGPSNSGSLRYGVYVEGGGSATIASNHITQIRDNPMSDAQDGVGIQVGFMGTTTSPATTGTARIFDNLIDNYQKGGIVVDNAGSSAFISGNQVLGTPNALIAQNGIQISNGAGGRVVSNIVTGNSYTGAKPAQGAGILLFNADKGVEVGSNVAAFNDSGVGVQGTVGAFLHDNLAFENTADGIDLYAGTSGAIVVFNFAFDNGQDGIYVNADNNQFVLNTALGNQLDGIQLDVAHQNVVLGNTASSNGRHGISQTNGSSNNVLLFNHTGNNGQGDFFP
jgi:parallel beta-helix repeat protein